MAGDGVAVVERTSRRSPSRSASGAKWSDGTAVHRRRRRLHLQRDEGRQGDRPQRALDRRRRSAHERDAARAPTRSSSPSTRRRSRTSTTSPTRRRSFRSTSGRRSTRASSHSVRRHQPGRHRPVPDVDLLAGRTSSTCATPTTGRARRAIRCPQVEEVDYPAFLSNTLGQPVSRAGPGAVGRPVHPEHPVVLHQQGPVDRHYWFPPVAERVARSRTSTNPLLEQPAGPPGDLAGDRPRHSLAARRERLSSRRPTRPASSCRPTQTWYDKSLDADGLRPGQGRADPEGGRLHEGLGRDLRRTRSGQPLSFTIKTISGYSDWDASLQMITQELKAVGIAVTVQDENSEPVHRRPAERNVPACLRRQRRSRAEPRPESVLRAPLDCCSAATSARRTTRASSRRRPTRCSTSTPASHAVTAAADHSPDPEGHGQDQFPLIPVDEGVDWYQYDTTSFGGWPTPSNPYAQPSPYQRPDNGVVLTHLYPE